MAVSSAPSQPEATRSATPSAQGSALLETLEWYLDAERLFLLPGLL